jgi:AraC-like DNA-binding protein
MPIKVAAPLDRADAGSRQIESADKSGTNRGQSRISARKKKSSSDPDFRAVSALAQELGYFDQAHFTKDFKSVTGMTPGRY